MLRKRLPHRITQTAPEVTVWQFLLSPPHERVSCPSPKQDAKYRVALLASEGNHRMGNHQVPCSRQVRRRTRQETLALPAFVNFRHTSQVDYKRGQSWFSTVPFEQFQS